jgi:hypothetical protein
MLYSVHGKPQHSVHGSDFSAQIKCSTFMGTRRILGQQKQSKRGLQTRAATGKNGYEYIRLRLGISLPSLFDAEWYFRLHDVRSVSIDEAAAAFLHQCKRTISNCYLNELSKMVIRKFFKVRMHIRAKFLTQHLKIQQSQFASRNAAARTTVR